MRKTNKQLLDAWRKIELASEWEESGTTPNGVIKLKSLTDIIYMYDNGEKLYIIVTGSNHLLEWFTNMFFWPTKGTHTGFRRAAERLYKTLYWDEAWNGLPVEVICHSRGVYGAKFAQLLVEDGFIDGEDTELITFGAPQIFTKKGAKEFDKTGIVYHRVDLEDDIVTGVVPFFTYYEEEYYLYPDVPWAMDHMAYKQALYNAIESEEK